MADDPDSDKAGKLEEAQQAVLLSIFAISSVFIIKLAVGLFSSSIALVADAFNSLADSTLLIIIYLALRVLRRKPDKKFRYGYYKLEDLLSLLISFAFIVVAIAVIIDGFRAVVHGFEGSAYYFEAAITEIVVACILFVVSWNQYRVAERANITSLALSARDMRVDVVSAIFVALSIVLNRILLFPLEGYATMIIGILIIQNALRGVTTAGRNLLDAWNRPEITRKIREIIEATGFFKAGEIRLRRAGPMIFGEVTIYAHQDLRLEEIDEILEAVENRIYSEIPDVKEIVFEVEPLETEHLVVGVPIVESPDRQRRLAPGLAKAEKIVIYHFYPNTGELVERGEVPVEPNGMKDREITICRQLKKLMVDIVVVKYISEVAYEVLKAYGIEVYVAESDDVQQATQVVKRKDLSSLKDYSYLEKRYSLEGEAELFESDQNYLIISARMSRQSNTPKKLDEEDIEFSGTKKE